MTFDVLFAAATCGTNQFGTEGFNRGKVCSIVGLKGFGLRVDD